MWYGEWTSGGVCGCACVVRVPRVPRLHEIRGGLGGFDAANAGAVAVLLEASAARVTPLPALPERTPHSLVVLLQHVLIVPRLGHHLLGTLHHPPGAVVLHVILRLSQEQTLGGGFRDGRVAER